jgi:hypothetical protein
LLYATGGITFVEGSTELTKAQGSALKCYGRESDQMPVHKLGCGKEALVDWQVSFQDVGVQLDLLRKQKCAPRQVKPKPEGPTPAEAAAAASSLFEDDENDPFTELFSNSETRDKKLRSLYAKEEPVKKPVEGNKRDDEEDNVIEHPAKEGDDNEVLLVVAQEFLDALPIEQFESTAEGWCERLVDINPDRGTGEGQSSEIFRFVRGNNIMPLMLAESAPLRPLPPKNTEVGRMLETGGAAIAVVEQIARAITANRGAALFVDYGGNPGVYGNSLRGIRDHEFVSTLSVSVCGFGV